MKKKLLAILLTVCMVLSMAPAALAADSVFTDVEAGDWFADEVKYVYDNGLMNGVGDNAFDPDGTVTRAMVWTTLARLDGVDTTGSDPWWLAGQKWAMENGISDGTMAENNITREQLVTMIWRYAKYIDMDVSEGEDTNILSYTDAFDVNEWAIPAMQWACAVGIINGIDGALQPQGDASRAMLAAILYRFVEEVMPGEEEPEPSTPVVPSYPIYPVIPPHSHSYTYTSNEDGTHQTICSCGTTTETCDGDPCSKCGYAPCTDTYTPNGDGTHEVTCSDSTHTGTEFCSYVEGGNLCECGFDRSTAVAKIAESEDHYYYYATLHDAITAQASKTGEVQLLSDIDLSDAEAQAAVYWPVTINGAKVGGGNYKVIGRSGSGATFATALAQGSTEWANGALTFKNLDIEVSANGQGLIYAAHAKAVTIDNCNITMGEGVTYGNYVMQGASGVYQLTLTDSTITGNWRYGFIDVNAESEVTITGNTFDFINEKHNNTTSRTGMISLETKKVDGIMVDVEGASNINITGNTFKNVNRVLAIDNAIIKADELTYTGNTFDSSARFALELDSTKDGNKYNYDLSGNTGTIRIQDADKSGNKFDDVATAVVAKIAGENGTATYYQTLAEAVTAQASKTGEVQLLSDINLGEAQTAIYWPVTINGDKAGGGNYKITGRTNGTTFETALAQGSTEWQPGALTFKNLDIEVSANGLNLIYAAHAKAVTIDNCNITMGEGVTYGDRLAKGGAYQLTLTNSTVTGNWRGGFIDVNAESEVTITGNTFDFVNEKHNNTTSRTGMISLKTTADVEGASNITITGNTFKNVNRVLAIDSAVIKADELTYTGNTFDSSARFALELDSTKDGNKYYYDLSGNTGTIRIQDASKSGDKFNNMDTAVSAKIVGVGYYATLDAAVAAVPANGTATITLLEDTTITGSTFTNTAGKNITVEGTGTAPNVTLGWRSCQASNGGTITFKNLSVVGHDHSNSDWYTEQMNGAAKVVYDGCTITGLITIYPTSEFTGCTFNTDGYYSIFVYNNGATFTGCTFNSDINRWVKIFDEDGTDTETLTLTNCTFVDTADGTNKACVEIDSTYGPLVVNITNTYAPDGETLYKDAKTPSQATVNVNNQ